MVSSVSACSACGAKAGWKRAEVEETVRVAGRTFIGSVRSEQCASCKEALIDGPDVEAFELAVAAELAQHGPVDGEALKYLRTAGLGMRATDLARLLDVSAETLSRWETGAMPLPRLPWAVVAALVLERGTSERPMIERLRVLAEPSRGARTAKVNIQRRSTGAAR